MIVSDNFIRRAGIKIRQARAVSANRQHAADYTQVLKELSDVHFPDAEQIRLVQDNLITHTPASLYAAFPTPEAPPGWKLGQTPLL